MAWLATTSSFSPGRAPNPSGTSHAPVGCGRGRKQRRRGNRARRVSLRGGLRCGVGDPRVRSRGGLVGGPSLDGGVRRKRPGAALGGGVVGNPGAAALEPAGGDRAGKP